MRRFLRSVLISIIITLLMARYLYQPLPAGFTQPSLVRAYGMILKIVFDLHWIGNSIGLNGAAIQRKALNAVVSLGSYTTPGPRSALTEMQIDGIPVRMYTPPNKRKGELLRTVIYFHGGGWVVGSRDVYHDVTDRLSHDLNALVFSVEYRLAPEHVFPAAFDDCVTVTKYLFQNAKTYGIDAMRIGLMGDSAGGNLAAAVSLKLRDEKFRPMPKAQILIYPSVQMLNLNTPSYQFNNDAAVLPRRYVYEWMSDYVFGSWRHIDILRAGNHTSPAIKRKLVDTFMNPDILPYDELRREYKPQPINQGNETFWNEYESVFMNPYLSPLMAENLKGLPPAYISSCKYDVLRDDSYFYEHRLKQAKIEVEHVSVNACLHAWLGAISIIDQFDTYFRDMVQSIGKLL